MAHSDSRRRRVLVVEDDSALRDVMLMTLDEDGYETQAAVDGGEALEILDAWRPDLILLDLMMPRLDGWSFRERQLARPDAAAIPVIVLSAGHNLKARVDALEATAILPKPFNVDALLAVVRALTGVTAPPLLHSPN